MMLNGSLFFHLRVVVFLHFFCVQMLMSSIYTLLATFGLSYHVGYTMEFVWPHCTYQGPLGEVGWAWLLEGRAESYGPCWGGMGNQKASCQGAVWWCGFVFVPTQDINLFLYTLVKSVAVISIIIIVCLFIYFDLIFFDVLW